MILSKTEVMKAVNKKRTEKIFLQEPVQTPDGGGGYKTVWTDRGSAWAEFRKPKLQTTAANGTVVSDMTREISIRYRPDVRKGWRVQYGAKTFDVMHTYEYGRETTVLVYKEVVK